MSFRVISRCALAKAFHAESREEVHSVTRFYGRNPEFYHEAIFKLVPRWDKSITVLGDCVKKIPMFQWDN
jgi:hypothetical protein